MEVTAARPLAVAAMLVACAAARAGQDDGPAGMPRYRLEVGRELSYRSTSDFKFENGAFHTTTDWTAWVLRKNDDGSVRVVLRQSQVMARDGSVTAREEPDVTLGYVDLFDDGRYTPNPSLGYQLDPSALFPRLPRDARAAAAGWEQPGKDGDGRTRYRAIAGADRGDELVFEGARESPEDKIYLSSHKGTYHFDRHSGLIRRITAELAQGYGFVGKGTGGTELKSSELRDAAWLKSFAADADRYFAASKAYDDLTTRAAKEAGAASAALLARAETALKDARAGVSLPTFKDQLDHQVRRHGQMASYYAEEASNRAAVLGKPAADWELKDLEGKSHALKDYRGKVVLLDFWYRGCGWCMRAMPQVKQLADDFRGRPVAVLGMNTDRDDKDARFVVDAMALNYPVLKAEGVPPKYKVRGFPTLVIIDPEGKVADVHVGYSPTLHDEVAKVVEGLLGKK